MTAGSDAAGSGSAPTGDPVGAVEPRGWGLSIVTWLVLGFVVVLAAFVTGGSEVHGMSTTVVTPPAAVSSAMAPSRPSARARRSPA